MSEYITHSFKINKLEIIFCWKTIMPIAHFLPNFSLAECEKSYAHYYNVYILFKL